MMSTFIISDERSRIELINRVAGEFHKRWQIQFRLDNPTVQTRFKPTGITVNGQETQVDILNTDYNDLPENRQIENKVAAEIAVNLLLEQCLPEVVTQPTTTNNDSGEAHFSAIPPQIREQCAEIIHIRWLERNSSWADSAQLLTYAELSEIEKNKDRAQIDIAFEIWTKEFSQNKC